MEELGGSLQLSDAVADGPLNPAAPGATITLSFPPAADPAATAARQRIA